jgi:cytoskeletal protein CcmA (bactofilin family)
MYDPVDRPNEAYTGRQAIERELVKAVPPRNSARWSHHRSSSGPTALNAEVMVKGNRPTLDGIPEAICIVGEGMTVQGCCETEGALIIDGTVKGDVYAKAVTIGKDGRMEGNIYAEKAVIAGQLLGSVYSASRLEVQSTGHLLGDVIAFSMYLAGGATLTGHVVLGERRVPFRTRASAGAKSASTVEPSPKYRGQHTALVSGLDDTR